MKQKTQKLSTPEFHSSSAEDGVITIRGPLLPNDLHGRSFMNPERICMILDLAINLTDYERDLLLRL